MKILQDIHAWMWEHDPFDLIELIANWLINKDNNER